MLPIVTVLVFCALLWLFAWLSLIPPPRALGGPGFVSLFFALIAA